MPTVLVTGATGTIGQRLVQRLANSGTPVRALVRNPTKAKADLPANIECIRGNLDDPDSVAAALRGVGRAVLITPGAPKLHEREARFIAAAKKARLRFLIKLSVINAHPASANAFGRWHARSELALVESGLPFAIVQSNFFMQNLLGSAPTVRAEGAIYGATGAGRASHVDAADVAEVIASLLLSPLRESAGTVHIVTGPEALTLADIADRIAAAIGRPVRAVELPENQFRAAMCDAGAPAWLTDATFELQSMARRGEASMITDTVRRIGGKEPTLLIDWATANAPAFK